MGPPCEAKITQSKAMTGRKKISAATAMVMSSARMIAWLRLGMEKGVALACGRAMVGDNVVMKKLPQALCRQTSVHIVRSCTPAIGRASFKLHPPTAQFRFHARAFHVRARTMF